ncbi:MAG: hypothetical protein HYV19_03380 [Gemmatimonadetes bacterium]|nr:hypothetical protein [Gemmatimonadota bacterium]
MTLVIEAAAVVVPILPLELSYPGGSDRYLLDAAHPRWKARHVLYDRHLTAASFESAEAAEQWANYSAEKGNLVGTDAHTGGDVAFMEQGTGPQAEVDWLRWELGADGVTLAWHRDDDQSERRIAPVCWIPRDSRRLARFDSRDDANLKQLSSQDGRAAWLNFDSGAIRTQEEDGFVPGASLLPLLAEAIESPLDAKRRAECVRDATELLRRAKSKPGVAIRRAENLIRQAEKASGFGGPLHAQASRKFLLELLRAFEKEQLARQAQEKDR